MGFISKDFLDFINALNQFEVRYILVGGYAVVLRGYSRSTGDMDIWIEPTELNYTKMQKAFYLFGLPTEAIQKVDFLGTEMDVFSFGVEPQAIDIMTAVKGLTFIETYETASIEDYEGSKIKIIHINNLIKAKESSGRFKDLNDIEHLKKLL
jgi:hypothetical protein